MIGTTTVLGSALGRVSESLGVIQEHVSQKALGPTLQYSNQKCLLYWLVLGRVLRLSDAVLPIKSFWCNVIITPVRNIFLLKASHMCLEHLLQPPNEITTSRH